MLALSTFFKVMFAKVMSSIIVAALLVALAAGHGALYMPAPRNALDGDLPEFTGGKSPLLIEACTCNNGNGGPNAPKEGCELGIRGPGDGQSCMWWSQGCSIGCDKCATETYGERPITGNPPEARYVGFNKRYCNNTVAPTLPRHAWTMNLHAKEGAEEDAYRYNPWRAPGQAPVVDPCGQAGGEYGYQHLGGVSVFYNTTRAWMGMMGSKLPTTPSANRTRWVAGTSVEVAWGPRFNHGGGYQYRLCPASEPLTEDCFQRHPLEFDRTKQVLKWNNGTLQYPMGSKAIFVDGDVVKPKGSTWARNPIPRRNNWNAGLHDPASCPGPDAKSGPGCLQFPPPCPWDHGILNCTEPGEKHNRRLHGHDELSVGICDANGLGWCSSDWTIGVISDHVLIPNDLLGDYVLGWRWDCEETAQVWQNCADVTITRSLDYV